MKDKRYNTLKKLIEIGSIKSLDEMLDIVPKTTIIKDTGINNTRFTNKLNHPEKFLVHDVLKISEQIGVNDEDIYRIIKKELNKPYHKKRLQKSPQ